MQMLSSISVCVVVHATQCISQCHSPVQISQRPPVHISVPPTSAHISAPASACLSATHQCVSEFWTAKVRGEVRGRAEDSEPAEERIETKRQRAEAAEEEVEDIHCETAMRMRMRMMMSILVRSAQHGLAEGAQEH